MESEIRSILTEGQSVVVDHRYSQADFDRFALLSGDDNPIHVDPDFAARTRFGRTVCHGMLLYGSICAILGERLLGPGALQLWQELKFTAPTYAGDNVQFKIVVVEISDEKNTAYLTTDIVHRDGSMACQGSTLVFMNIRHFHRNPVQDLSTHAEENGDLKGLHIGQRAQLKRTFHQEELDQYAELTGDSNPMSIDPDYAIKQGFKGTLIPGPMLGGLISNLLGTKLPGRGTMWLKQRFDYWAPAHPEEPITAAVEILKLRPEKHLVNLSNECRNANNTLICSGESLVLVRDLEVVV